MVRPTWERTFLDIATVMSRRSHDEHTHCGCVIVDENNHIVSCGYNGFIGGINDSGLPLTRPEKYTYMIHSEENAIINSTCQLHGCTAYITVHPCIRCLQLMWQAGIRKIIIDGKNKIPQIVKDQEALISDMLARMQTMFIYTYED